MELFNHILNSEAGLVNVCWLNTGYGEAAIVGLSYIYSLYVTEKIILTETVDSAISSCHILVRLMYYS